ncbi:MAG: hypothetical protein RLZZ416_516 [Candidatus Parcubacteria bacterium]|jgi:hypothetical protein
MRYFGDFSVRFGALTLAALFVAAPFAASAQVGYGGGGPIGLFGAVNTNPAGVSSVNPPQGRVLGASIFQFTRTLLRGMDGDDVRELQKILKEQGFLDVNEPSDHFGPLTENALKRFQSAHGLEPVGILGPLTRSLFNTQGTSDSTPPKLSESERGALIAQLQARLIGVLEHLRALLASR